MVTHRILAGAAATWVTGYLALYLFLIRRSEGTLAVWYVVLLLVVVVLLLLVVAGRTARAGTVLATAILLPSMAIALTTIGLLLLPGLLISFVTLGFALRVPARRPGEGRPGASAGDGAAQAAADQGGHVQHHHREGGPAG